jgi:multidrug efflux pump subunit AcrA (membrane-fusion protein)
VCCAAFALNVFSKNLQGENMKLKSGIFLLVMLAVLWLCGCSDEKKAATPPPPPEVMVAEVVQKDVPVYREWVASMDGIVNATILAQVEGYLVKQNYKEGDFVKKGTMLFEIDPRPFQASVEEAKAALARYQAVLTTAKANLKRILPLAAANAVSQRDKDNAVGAAESAEADVLGARAHVRRAELDLSFTRIISPIDGIAGRLTRSRFMSPSVSANILKPSKIANRGKKTAPLLLMICSSPTAANGRGREPFLLPTGRLIPRLVPSG